MILSVLRYLLGFVRFRALGGFPERFINLCAQRGVKIRDVKIDEKTLEATVNAADYKKLRDIAKRSGMKMQAYRKRGLPFFVARNKDRSGLAVGAVFFCVFLSISSLFIWNVETVGGENISDEEIINTVNQLGLYTGAFSPKIDEVQIAKNAMTVLNGKLSWIAVNIKGCRALVEVRDYIPRRDDETYKEPCNIVADFDGLLLSLEVYNGQKANYEGNGVKKGDLLISGIAENRDTSSIFMEARGKITALHSDEVSVCTQEAEQKTYTLVKSVNYLYFFSLKIPLGFFGGKDNFDEFCEKKQLCFANRELPFAIEKKTRAYYQVSQVITDSATLLFDEYTAAAYEKYKNTNVLSTEYKISESKNMLTLTGYNECIDFMGQKQEIIIE